MAVTESPDAVGLRGFDEFAEVSDAWPPGEPIEAMRAAAVLFKAGGQVRGPEE